MNENHEDHCKEQERFYWLDFNKIDNEEKLELIELLKEKTNFAPQSEYSKVVFCKTKLEFYERTWLIILTDTRNQRNHRTEFLLYLNLTNGEQEKYVHPLYRTSTPIHEFNTKYQNLNLTSKEYATNYLRFFTEAIEGQEGPFFLVDGVDSIPYHVKDESKEEITQLIKNQQLFQEPISNRIKTNKDGFEVEAMTLYSNALFRAKYLIWNSGMVEMLNDEVLIEYLFIEELSKYEHFILIRYEEGVFKVVSAEDFKSSLLQRDTNAFEKLFESDPTEEDKERIKGNTLKVAGNVRVVGEQITFPITIPENKVVVFEGDLIFQKTTFLHPIRLHNCLIRGGILSFESCKIEGELDIRELTLEPRFDITKKSLDLSKSVINGDLVAEKIRVGNDNINIYEGDEQIGIMHGDVNLSKINVLGSIFLNDSNIGEELICFGASIEGSLYLTNAKIGYSVDLSYSRVKDALNLSNTSIGGDLNSRAIKVGFSVAISGSNIRGDVIFTFAEMGALFSRLSRKERTIIGENLVLSGADFKAGHIEVVGSLIQGSIICISPKNVRALYLKGASVGEGGFSEVIYCEIGWGVLIANLNLNGNLSCFGIKVGSLHGVPVDSVKQGTFEFFNCFVRGKVRFYSKNLVSNDFFYFIESNGEFFKITGKNQARNHNSYSELKDFSKEFSSNFNVKNLSINSENIYEYLCFYYYFLFPEFANRVYLASETEKSSVSPLQSEIYEEVRIKFSRQEINFTTDRKYKIKCSYINEKGSLRDGVFTIDPEADNFYDHIIHKDKEEDFKDPVISLNNIWGSIKFFIPDNTSRIHHEWKNCSQDEVIEFINKVGSSLKLDIHENEKLLYKMNLPFLKRSTLYGIKDNIGSWNFPSTINGNLNLSGLEVIGNIDLGNMTVKGEMNLSQAKVNGSIIFHTPSLNSNEFKLLQNIGKTKCANLNLEAVQVHGNLIMSHVEVLKSDEYNGDLVLRRSVIQNSLVLYEDNPNFFLELDGDLNLSDSSISSIKIAESNFKNCKTNATKISQKKLLRDNSSVILKPLNKEKRTRKNNQVQTLRLERASIGLFDWQGIISEDMNIKFRDFNVKTWSENGINNLEKFLNVGGRDAKRNTYIELERTLRNQGYDEMAERVYKEMWKNIKEQKVNGESRSWRYKKFCEFRSWFGYGRYLARIFFLIFIIFILSSILIFSNPKNIIPSAITLAGTHVDFKQIPPGISPDKNDWGLGNGLWFTLRYNVPIIPFNAKAQWRPNINKIYFLGFESKQISAQDYAEFIEFSHWIIWSIFLIYLSGILRRGETFN